MPRGMAKKRKERVREVRAYTEKRPRGAAARRRARGTALPASEHPDHSPSTPGAGSTLTAGLRPQGWEETSIHHLLPKWLRGKEPPCQCRRHTSSREDPLEEEQQATPVFLPGECHGPRKLVGYSAQGHKELDVTELKRAHAACAILLGQLELMQKGFIVPPKPANIFRIYFVFFGNATPFVGS